MKSHGQQGIYQRPLKPRGEVNASLFSFMLTEVVGHLMEQDAGEIE